MRRSLKTSLLTLAAWGLLAAAAPAPARAQVYYEPPVIAYSAPVVTYSAPAPVVTYSVPVVRYSAPVVTYSAPVVTYYAPRRYVAYSAPVYVAPVYVAPVRYSFYSPVITAAPPVYASTSYYVRPGLFRPRVYSATTYYGPAPSYGAVYGSAYYTPLYFRY
jgi:hypothetical protein